jgi:hypothetical protein
MEELITLQWDDVTIMLDGTKHFLDKWKTGNPPEIVIVAWPVGTGKTRLIKSKYKDDYVWIDPNEIANYITDNWKKNIENLQGISWAIASNLLARGISDKKNYVIELTFTKPEIVDYIKEYMEKIWYKISIDFVISDEKIAWENNISRSETNMSSFYTEDAVYALFRDFFENTYNKLAREEWLKEID